MRADQADAAKALGDQIMATVQASDDANSIAVVTTALAIVLGCFARASTNPVGVLAMARTVAAAVVTGEVTDDIPPPAAAAPSIPFLS